MVEGSLSLPVHSAGRLHLWSSLRYSPDELIRQRDHSVQASHPRRASSSYPKSEFALLASSVVVGPRVPSRSCFHQQHNTNIRFDMSAVVSPSASALCGPNARVAFRLNGVRSARATRPLRCRPISASAETTSKSLEIMRKFSEQYAKRSGTYFCVDKSVTAVVIKGLAEHKDELGAPLCPCRHYDDKQAEADQGFWN